MSQGFDLHGEPLNRGSVWHNASLGAQCFQNQLDQVNSSCNTSVARTKINSLGAAGTSSGTNADIPIPALQCKLPQSVENQASVLQKACSQYGGALSTELTTNWQTHLNRNVNNMQTAAVFAYMFSRVPKVAGLLAIVATADGVTNAAQHTAAICSRAAEANSDCDRDAAANAMLHDAVTESINLIPGAIGAGWGTWGGRAASQAVSDFAVHRCAKSPLNISQIEFLANVPHRIRAYLSEARSDVLPTWSGPGSQQLSSDLINADGTHNLMGITKWLADQHIWQGTEVTRYVRKSDLRASMVNTGAPRMVFGVKYNGEDVYDFHIHPPRPSSVPSLADQRSANGFGIIQSGDQTTLYLPKKQFDAELGVGCYDKKNLPDVHVIFDRNRRMAMEVHPDIDDGARALDYDELEKRLTRFDGNWSTLRSIPTVPKPNKDLKDFVWKNHW